MSTNELNKMKDNQKRMCHIIKRPDFDGYGFNLHSEKGKIGQYIGKVDENSPAEQAGLRQGDRILEVNGVKIGLETHKQVVQRIKAMENEVRLVVVDPQNELDEEQQQMKAINMSATISKEIIDKMEPSVLAIGVSDDVGNSESIHSHKTVATTSKLIDEETAFTQPNENNNSNSKPQQKAVELNLSMTAAEMKAKLMAKKKVDVRGDTVDVRKKFEIIQKL